MRANKVSLNTVKTQLFLFTSPKKQPNSELKIKFNRKKSMKLIQLNI